MNVIFNTLVFSVVQIFLFLKKTLICVNFITKMSKLVLSVVFLVLILNVVNAKIVNKRKCPEVRAVPHFDLTQVS